VVHSRKNFQKRYDFAERLMPGVLAKAAPDADAFARWHVERSLHAMGAATEADLSRYMTFPRLGKERKKVVAQLIREGLVREIAIEGERGRWYALERDLEHLAAAGRRRSASRGTTLLSPFDSLLWHRERAVRLFGFDYRIEVYVPAPKRLHGYYVLPVLHDGHFVGRADLKTHREHGKLEIRNLRFEGWVVNGGRPPAAGWGGVTATSAIQGFADAARDLARFVGAESVSVGRVTPAKLARAVRSALGG
jgi:uncharacterized protein YcaQ